MNVHITVSIAPEKLESFDRWWKAEGFKSRSEAISYLITANVKEKGAEDDYA